MTIKIRHALPDDATAIAEIFDTESVIAQTGQLPYRTPAFWQVFYKTANPAAIELVAELNGRVVGHLGISPDQRPRRRHVGSFGLAVHAEAQRQGVATALMDELVKLADNWLNLLKIELTVYADNAGAIALYERYDFAIEGTLKFDMFRDGKYVDALIMGRIHPERRALFGV